MKPLTKLYLKLFIVTGPPFAILMIISNYLFLVDEDTSIVYIVFQFILYSILFGGGMSFFLAKIYKNELRKNGKETIENTNVWFSKTIESDISIDILINKLKSDKFFSKSKITYTKTTINIKKRISFYSWGETINILFEKIENNPPVITITSKPGFPLTIIDYGVNQKNVEKIANLIYENQ